MEILFATPGFGADPSTSFMPLVATELERRGHSVEGVQYEPIGAVDYLSVDRLSVPNITTPWWVGNWVTYQVWPRRLRSYLGKDTPDIIVADRACLAPTVRAGRAVEIPVVGVIPGLGFTRFNPLDFGYDKTPSFKNLPWSAKIQYPVIRSLFREHREMLHQSAALVTVSEFVQQSLWETFGVESEVIRTPAHLSNIRANSDSPEYLTLVNPRTKNKGADVLVKLAESLTHEQFRVAGTFASGKVRNRVEDLDNVEALGWVDDISRVFSNAELLLVPSRYEEGGPRVLVEAFANGVPAVGTDRGGIPEFIDGAGRVVSDPDDIAEWRRKIETVRENRAALSEAASERAELFDADTQVDRFEALLESVIGTGQTETVNN